MNLRNRIARAYLVTALAFALAFVTIAPTRAADSEYASTNNITQEQEEGKEYTLVAGVSAVTYDIFRNMDIEISATNVDTVGVGIEEEEVIEEVVEEEVIEEPPYTPVDYTMYVNSTAGLNARTSPDTSSDSNVIDIIPFQNEVEVIGEYDDYWVVIQWSNDALYVSSEYLQSEYPEDPEVKTYNYTWNGEVLNSVNGKIHGPSGVETYYNMEMGNIVDRMYYKGYCYEYWIRSDGVKMLGDYVLIAADFDKYPIGTLVETSLGIGIVADTGSFVDNGSGVDFDIAVSW